MIHWSHYLNNSCILQMLEEASFIALSLIEFFRFNFLIQIWEVCCLLSIRSKRHLDGGLTLNKIRMHKMTPAQNKGSSFHSLFTFHNCTLFHEVKYILYALGRKFDLVFTMIIRRRLFHYCLVMMINISAFSNSGGLPYIFSGIYTQLWCFF
jgi:hypothetical protein